MKATRRKFLGMLSGLPFIGAVLVSCSDKEAIPEPAQSPSLTWEEANDQYFSSHVTKAVGESLPGA